MEKQISEYIRHCLQAGITKETITRKLRENNWPPDLIEKAYHDLSNPQTNNEGGRSKKQLLRILKYILIGWLIYYPLTLIAINPLSILLSFLLHPLLRLFSFAQMVNIALSGIIFSIVYTLLLLYKHKISKMVALIVFVAIFLPSIIPMIFSFNSQDIFNKKNMLIYKKPGDFKILNFKSEIEMSNACGFGNKLKLIMTADAPAEGVYIIYADMNNRLKLQASPSADLDNRYNIALNKGIQDINIYASEEDINDLIHGESGYNGPLGQKIDFYLNSLRVDYFNAKAKEELAKLGENLPEVRQIVYEEGISEKIQPSFKATYTKGDLESNPLRITSVAHEVVADAIEFTVNLNSADDYEAEIASTFNFRNTAGQSYGYVLFGEGIIEKTTKQKLVKGDNTVKYKVPMSYIKSNKYYPYFTTNQLQLYYNGSFKVPTQKGICTAFIKNPLDAIHLGYKITTL